MIKKVVKYSTYQLVDKIKFTFEYVEMDMNLNSKKILIVDDTPANILLLKEVLSHYRISTASNGEEALARIFHE